MRRGQINSHLNCQRARPFFFFFLSSEVCFSIHAHSAGAISVMIPYQHAQVPRPLNAQNNPNTKRE